jgi:hypothetical protein
VIVLLAASVAAQEVSLAPKIEVNILDFGHLRPLPRYRPARAVNCVAVKPDTSSATAGDNPTIAVAAATFCAVMRIEHHSNDRQP